LDDHLPSDPRQARLAVEEVLGSSTFARSEQLRSFLRYVCERAIAGTGKDINEYSVAVEALGKPPDFSPAEDSSVRRTAYDLRQKLHKYYEEERPDSVIRIELPKGSYSPRFVEVAAAPAIALGDKESPPGNRAVWALAAALAAALLVCVVLGVMLVRTSPRLPAVVREAWSPITAPGDKVLISVGTTLHLIVRPYMTVVAEGLPKYPAPPELYPLFRQHRPLQEGVELSMHPVDNSVQLGHAETMAIATSNLSLMDATYQVLPERSASAPALRGRSVILVGDPQNSNTAAHKLEDAPLTLGFDDGVQDVVVRERAGAHQVWAGKRGADKRYTEVFGLISVLPGEGDATHRMLIFSGITSVGTQGAAEFFSRPEGLNVLREKLATEGYSKFPAAYQVVVRCTSNDTLLLSTEYAAHRVIAK
jgi:hypothetical protein